MRDGAIDRDTLGRVGFFRELSAADLGAIMRVAGWRSLRKGEVLFRQGEAARAFFVIVRGRIKAGQVTAEGQELTVRLLGPGEMIGGPALFGDAAYPVTASAVEAAVLLRWTGPAIATLVSRYPQLARNMMLAMARRIVELQEKWRELATEPVQRRVARALLRLAAETGKPVEGGILLGVRLSRQDLSEMVGATLFTVSRVLSKWSRAGVIAAGREKVTLRRPHYLRCIAEGLAAPADG